MMALLDRVILVVGHCFSWLWILLSIPFLPAKVLFCFVLFCFIFEKSEELRVARRHLEPGYAPSKWPGRSLGIQPGPEPIPTEGRRETEGLGKRTPHSLEVLGDPRSRRAQEARLGRWRWDRWERSLLPLNTSETPSWSEEQSERPTVFQYIWRSKPKDRGHWKIRW